MRMNKIFVMLVLLLSLSCGFATMKETHYYGRYAANLSEWIYQKIDYQDYSFEGANLENTTYYTTLTFKHYFFTENFGTLFVNVTYRYLNMTETTAVYNFTFVNGTQITSENENDYTILITLPYQSSAEVWFGITNTSNIYMIEEDRYYPNELIRVVDVVGQEKVNNLMDWILSVISLSTNFIIVVLQIASIIILPYLGVKVILFILRDIQKEFKKSWKTK